MGPGGSDATQVKYQRQPLRRLTLNSPEATSALENAWRVIRDNPTRPVTYHHITRALPGRERGDPLGFGIPGLELWKKAQISPLSECTTEAKRLQEFVALRSALSSELREWAGSVSVQDFHDRLLCRVIWQVAAPDRMVLMGQIEEKLVLLGRTVSLDAQDSRDALGSLYQSILSTAANDGARRLTRADLMSAFDLATRASLPKSLLGRLLQGFNGHASERLQDNMPDDWVAQMEAWLRRELNEPQLFAPTQKRDWIRVTIEDFHTTAPLGHGAEAIAARLQPGSTVAIIGGSGSGKTTLLKQIALHACESRTAIPFVIDCATFVDDLQNSVAAQARALQCLEPKLREIYTAPVPLLLLCDDFHRCRDKKALLTQIRSLQSRGAGAAAVLLAHEMPGLDLLGSASLPAFRIGDLGDDDVKRVFERYLSKETAQRLLDETITSGDLDAFRSPLLASLLAQARRGTSDGVPVAANYRKGQLYREVISDGALGVWTGQRRPDLSSPLSGSIRRVLGLLARLLLERGDDDLSQADLLAAGTRNPSTEPLAELLECAESCGFIWRREGRCGFTHIGIRDYFAGEDLALGPPHRLMVAWFSPRWHSSLKIFASLAKYDRRHIFWLRICCKLTFKMISVLRSGGYTYQTRLFYFLLEFACESLLREDWLQLEAFRFFRDGTVYLSDDVPVPYRPLRHHVEDRYSYACLLVGKLSHSEVHHWLRDQGSRFSLRFRVHGIAQDRSVDGLKALLASLADETDRIAHELAAELAFDYPAEIFEPVARDFLSNSDAPRVQFLRAIHLSASDGSYSDHEYAKYRQSKSERLRGIIFHGTFWRDILLELLLRAEKPVANAAQSILRNFDRGSWLRSDIRDSLAHALQHGEPEERRRAASSLRYAGHSPEIIGLLRRCVCRDPDFITCASAADSLLLWDRRRTHAHMLTMLSRWGGRLDEERLATRDWFIGPLLQTLRDSPYGRSGTRQFRLLTVYAAGAEASFDRMLAVFGLRRFSGRCAAELLRDLFQSEDDLEVRRHLAEAWAWHPAANVDEVASSLIDDEQSRIRETIGSWMLQRGDNLTAEAVERLRVSSTTDPDEDVRQMLVMGIKSIDRTRALLDRSAGAHME